MTKEQLNNLREYYTVKFPKGYQYSRARNDVIALLDYIAELESRLKKSVELPCNTGDKLYWVGNYRGKKRVVEYTVEDVTISNGKPYVISCGRTLWFLYSDLGRDVFLTREEAEQALKGTVTE